MPDSEVVTMTYHLAQRIVDELEAPPDPDGTYAEFAREVLEKGRQHS